MTIEQKLAMLEEVAPVIDIHRLLRRSRAIGNVWVAGRGSWGSEVCPEVALAIREKQAREWIERWCEGRGLRFAMRINRTINSYLVSIDAPWGPDERITTEAFAGKSYAEALAACIKKLSAMKEQDDG